MSQFMLGWPNYTIDTDIFTTTVTSTTVWSDSLPLNNVKSKYMHEIAYTASTSTTIKFDFSISREIDIVSLENHNLTPSDSITISAGSSSGGSDLYTSGAIQAIPSISRGPVTTASTVKESMSNYPKNSVHIVSPSISSRYWTISISGASPISLGRASFWKGWSPGHNFNRGVQLGWSSDSIIESSYTGVEYVYKQEPYRIAKFNIEYVDGTTGLEEIFDLLNYVSIDKELFFIFNTSDTIEELFRRSFPAKMTTLSPLSYSYLEYTSSSFALKEIR